MERSTSSDLNINDTVRLENFPSFWCIWWKSPKMVWNGNRKRFDRFPIFQRNLNLDFFHNTNLPEFSRSDNADWAKIIVKKYIKCYLRFVVIVVVAFQRRHLPFIIVTLCACITSRRSCLSASAWTQAFSSLSRSTWQCMNVCALVIVVYRVPRHSHECSHTCRELYACF